MGLDVGSDLSSLNWRGRECPRRVPLRPLLSELNSGFDLFPLSFDFFCFFRPDLACEDWVLSSAKEFFLVDFFF